MASSMNSLLYTPPPNEVLMATMFAPWLSFWSSTYPTQVMAAALVPMLDGPPRHLRFITFVFQPMPATPSPLSGTAPTMPATWMPWSVSGSGSTSLFRPSMPWMSSIHPLPSSSTPAAPALSTTFVHTLAARSGWVTFTPESSTATTTDGSPCVMSQALYAHVVLRAHCFWRSGSLGISSPSSRPSGAALVTENCCCRAVASAREPRVWEATAYSVVPSSTPLRGTSCTSVAWQDAATACASSAVTPAPNSASARPTPSPGAGCSRDAGALSATASMATATTTMSRENVRVLRVARARARWWFCMVTPLRSD